MSAGDDKTLKVEDLILRLFCHPLIALESLNSENNATGWAVEVFAMTSDDMEQRSHGKWVLGRGGACFFVPVPLAASTLVIPLLSIP